MLPTTPSTSRRWPRACRYLLRPETAARRAAIGDLALPRTASASAPPPPRPTTLRWEEPTSPILPNTPAALIGVPKTAQPMARPSRTFRRFPGTTRAPAPPWRFITAIRLATAPAAFVEAHSRSKRPITFKWPRAAAAQADAPRAFRRQI